MTFSSQDWQQLSSLFDIAVELDPQQQQWWLANLPQQQAHLRQRLCELLDAHQQAEATNFLVTIPKITALDPSDDTVQKKYAAGMCIGPWELQRELGRGGMASVWLSVRKNGEFKREIALKLPHPDLLSASLISRFIRERDILSRLIHPNIARLYDAGISEDQQAWLALEYVKGKHINEWCRERQLDLRSRLQLLIQVCSAVQYAHSHLIVHGDLKPGNILVTDEGYVRLLDFGIAQILQGEGNQSNVSASTITENAGRAITWRYASPEQIRGERLGITNDVYSLGVILYELLTGDIPYQLKDNSRHALEQAILNGSIDAPSRRITDKRWQKIVRGDLDTIVFKALKKTPQERYSTVDAFSADLKRYLNGDPVQARPDSLWYRTGKWLRKHRWIAATVCLFSISIFTALLISIHQTQIATAEAARSKAMYQFVVSLFNPDDKPDLDLARRQMTLKDLVRLGVDKLIADLREKPEERAKLLHDLGQLSVQLGLQEEAEKIYTTSLHQARQTYGDQSNAYAAVLLDSVEWLSGNSRSREACEYADKALDIYQKNKAPPEKLAIAYRKAGHCGVNLHPSGFVRDIQYLETAVDLSRQGSNQAELSNAWENLGLAYLNADRAEAALAAFNSALLIRQQLYGSHAWQTAESQQSLAVTLDKLGQTAASAQYRLQALESMQNIWGKNHYFVSESLAYLADMLVDSKRRREGLAYAKDAYQIMLLPDWKNQKLDYLENATVSYLKILLRSGDLQEMHDVCEGFPWVTPVSYPILRNILLGHCGSAYLYFGETEKAQQFALANMMLWKRHWPNQESRSSGAHLLNAQIARYQQRTDDAISEYRETLRTAANKTHYAQTEAWLGLSELAPKDSRLLPLEQLRSELEFYLKPGQRDYWAGFEANMREAIGNVLLARGQHEMAQAELEMALRIREQADDPQRGLWLARNLLALANCIQLSDPIRAKQLRSRAGKITKYSPVSALRLIGTLHRD